MADTALARLRGILAATMTRAEIDQLLREVLAEQQPYLRQIDALHAEQPIPYTLAEPARCCMCSSTDVRYRNYLEQPFCWPCADGTSPQGKAAVAASLAELDQAVPDAR